MDCTLTHLRATLGDEMNYNNQNLGKTENQQMRYDKNQNVNPAWNEYHKWQSLFRSIGNEFRRPIK